MHLPLSAPLLLTGLALWAHAGAHAAEAYPVKPVRVLVGTTAGSGSDLMMRVAAAKLSDKWNRSVVIDNRPGAVGAIAIDIASQAAPDGYTLLTLSAQNVAGMVSRTGSVDLAKAFAPVVQMVTVPYDIASWNGVFAPAGTPDAVIRIINRDVAAVTNTPEMKEKVSADAAEVAPPNTPAEFRKLLAREIQTWDKIVRASGIRIE